MKSIILIFLICSLTACSLNPQNADMDLTNTLPEAKESVYSEAISELSVCADHTAVCCYDNNIQPISKIPVGTIIINTNKNTNALFNR